MHLWDEWERLRRLGGEATLVGSLRFRRGLDALAPNAAPIPCGEAALGPRDQEQNLSPSLYRNGWG